MFILDSLMIGGLRFVLDKLAAAVDTELKFMLTRHRESHKQPFGEALLSRVYWPWYFRHNGWQFWGQFLERFGTPLLLGKVSSPKEWVQLMQQLGIDSVVAVEGKLFDKPRSREEAAEHLRFFSDKVLHLTSAVALVRNGSVEASDVGMAELKVRPLTEAFIQSYLDAEWPEVGHCVGVFRIEGRGVQLFDRINGGHFTILGMPLIPLLKALRERELLQS